MGPSMSLTDYNLSRNPFPAEIGVPPERVSFWADRADTKKKLFDLVNETLSSRNSTIITIFGDYGMGKTHTLKFLENYLEENEGLRAFALYLGTSGTSFLDLYRNFIAHVTRDRLIDYAKRFTGTTYRLYAKRLIRDTDEGDILLEELPRYLTDVDLIRSQVRKITRELSGPDFPDFASVLVQLPMKEKEEIVWNWISAERRIGAYELRSLNIGSRIETNDDAINAFNSILNILHEIGYIMVFVLIDEMERLIEQASRRDREIYTSFLRRLIDSNPIGLCLVMACTLGLEEEFKGTIHPALLERIPPRNEITLEPLSNDHVKQFIIDHLNDVRITMPPENEMAPFEEGVLDLLADETKGDVREIIRACYRLIEEGVRLGLKEIDTDQAREILQMV